MNLSHESLKLLGREARQRRARRALDRIADLRAVGAIASAGKTPVDIATLLHMSETRVRRAIDTLERRGGNVEVEPMELILLAFVEDSPRPELMCTLRNLTYTAGIDAPPPHEGRIKGTWDQVVEAYAQGLLSDAEFTELRNSPANPERG